MKGWSQGSSKGVRGLAGFCLQGGAANEGRVGFPQPFKELLDAPGRRRRAARGCRRHRHTWYYVIRALTADINNRLTARSRNQDSIIFLLENRGWRFLCVCGVGGWLDIHLSATLIMWQIAIGLNF